MSLIGIGSSAAPQVQGTYTFSYSEASRQESLTRFESSDGQSQTKYSSSTRVEVSEISITLAGDEEELNALFAKLDEVFRSAADRAFTSDEEDFLDALEGEIEEVLARGGLETPSSGDPFANLPPELAQQLDDANKAIELLYAAAENGKLTNEQLDELDERDEEIDDLLAAFEAPDFGAISGPRNGAIAQIINSYSGR